MPETIEKKKTTQKRPKAFPAETGAVRVEELFPEVKAKKTVKTKSDPALKPATTRTVQKKSDPALKPVAAKPAKKSDSTLTSVRSKTPSGGVPAVPAKKPASGVTRTAPTKPAARKAAPEQASASTRPEAEKPRVKLIAATGVGLTLLFICLIILNSSMQISTIQIEEKMAVGEIAVRHESWEPGNAIIDVTSLDPAVADVDIFLVQDEEEPGFVHFLINATKDGVADIVVEYENKDRKVITVTVEPSESESTLVKEDKKSKSDTLDKVREYLKTGDELMADGNKSVENVFKALTAYQKAQRTIRQIRLHQFLPEYKGLDEKIQSAQDQIEVSYKKVEAEYQVARDRQMHWKARDLLKILMQIVPDAKDARYLKNRTYLDFLHNKEA